MIHKISRQNFDFEPLLETLDGNNIQKFRSHQAVFTETKSNNFHKFNIGNDNDFWKYNLNQNSDQNDF